MKEQKTLNNADLTLSIKKRFEPLLTDIADERIKAAIENFVTIHLIQYFTFISEVDTNLNIGNIKAEQVTDEVIKKTHAVLDEADKLDDYINDNDLINKIKILFRIIGAPYALQSDFVKHAYEKPGGYAGDYETLEFIYNNKPTSKNIGYCADMVFLTDDYARAVRNRKDQMKKILSAYLKSDPPSARILNIACGSSRDLREMFRDYKFQLSGKINFTLIDKSQKALDFSRKELSNHQRQIEFEFLNHSVYDYLKHPQFYSEQLQNFNMIYSIGLADYIPEQSLKDIIAFLFNLLAENGKLIIAHKDSKNYHPTTPDWWTDWTFYLRSEEDLIRIIKECGIKNYNLSIENEDETNIIFFLIIEKI